MAGAWNACETTDYLNNSVDYAASETCDGLDNNCAGGVDDGLVPRACQVSNGWGTCAGTEDCQGVSGWQNCTALNPQQEVCDDVDNNCDGDTDAADADLLLADCELSNGVCSGATHRSSLCVAGSWNACTAIDYGADYGAETCDDEDNDCDGLVDGADGSLALAPCENLQGVCSGATHVAGQCVSGAWQGCTGAEYIANSADYGSETCDALDNDCDSMTDGGDPSLVATACEMQDGVCSGSLHRPSLCVAGAWDACEFTDYRNTNSNYELVEICDGLDNNCSGLVDDKDVDGDGHLDENCGGGDDCDDDDPLTYPGASEIRDTSDNDCDGTVDEGGLIDPGAIIVSEFLADPTVVDDNKGEYFEVTNVTYYPVNLHSWWVKDDLNDNFYVSQPEGLILQPGGVAVFCANALTVMNGGVICDYEYGYSMQISNSGDEIILELDGVQIDRITYSSDTAGRSTGLDPAYYDATANNNTSNWCVTPAQAQYQLPDGDYGTPGDYNYACKGLVAVLAVEPTSGQATGGETITLIGANFTGFGGGDWVRINGNDCTGMTVIDDEHLTCTTPANPAGDHDLVISLGGNTSTLTNGYRTTSVAGASSITWCELNRPSSMVVGAGVQTSLIHGRVTTPITANPGPPAGVTAQVGIGPSGSNPTNAVGWTWWQAGWNAYCGDCGTSDEFTRSLIVDTAGAYSVAYRFSDDDGYTFVFCDLPPGTTDGFSSADLGDLTITP